MTQQTGPAYFDDVTEYVDAFDDGEYVVTLVRVETAEAGKYGPSLRWIWNLKNLATGEVVPAADSSGGNYVWHQDAGTKMTPRVKHYPWVSALLGRAPEIGESGVALVKACLGKSMVAYCGRPAGCEPGTRQKILTCKPVPAAGAPRAVQAPAPAIAPPAEEDDEEALLARLAAARAKKGAENREKAGVTDEAYRAIFDNQVPA